MNLSGGNSGIRQSGGGSFFSVLLPVRSPRLQKVTDMARSNVQAAFAVRHSFATKTQLSQSSVHSYPISNSSSCFSSGQYIHYVVGSKLQGLGDLVCCAETR